MQVFPCEFFKIPKNTYFTERLRATASLPLLVFCKIVTALTITVQGLLGTDPLSYNYVTMIKIKNTTFSQSFLLESVQHISNFISDKNLNTVQQTARFYARISHWWNPPWRGEGVYRTKRFSPKCISKWSSSERCGYVR